MRCRSLSSIAMPQSRKTRKPEENAETIAEENAKTNAETNAGTKVEDKLEERQEFPIARDGGLKHAERILGLRLSKEVGIPPDAVIVSIKIKLCAFSLEIQNTGVPEIEDIGIACLDTRDLHSEASASGTTRAIKTHNFSLNQRSTNSQKCAFTETITISEEEIVSRIVTALRVRDTRSSDPQAFRKIVIIGYHVRNDLKILKRLGIKVRRIAPVLGLLDTNHVARHLLQSQRSLFALLEKLQCPFKLTDSGSAGNEATYALHALLKLVGKVTKARERRLNTLEKQNFKHLRENVALDRPRTRPDSRD